VYFQHPESERFWARAVRDGERIPAQSGKSALLDFSELFNRIRRAKLGVVRNTPDGNATPYGRYDC
jgi:hypothetical protein